MEFIADAADDPLDGVIPHVRVAPLATLGILSRAELDALCRADVPRILVGEAVVARSIV